VIAHAPPRPPADVLDAACYRPRVRLAALAALAGAVLAGRPAVRRADASPGEDDLIDGAVFAGATAPHPGNVTGNPAALLRLTPGVHLFVHGSLRVDKVGIDRRTIDPDTGAAGPGPTVDDSVLSGGGVGGFALAQTNRLVALSFAWRPDERTIGRDATAFHSRGDLARRIDWLTIAGGFRLTGKLYLGLSGTLADRRQRLLFARDTALEAGVDPARGVGSDCGGAPCGFEHPAAREEWVIDVEPRTILSTDNLVYTVGVMLEARKDLWIGIATERPWQLGALTMAGAAQVTAAPRDGGAVRRGQADVSVRLPVVWRLGVRGRVLHGWDAIGEVRLRQLERTGVYDVHTLGGDLQAGAVPEWYPRRRGLIDALAAWGGLEQVDDGRVARVGAWLGADSGAADPTTMSATSPWGAELAGAFGLQLRLRGQWVLQLGAQARYQVPTTSGPSAFDPRARLECAASGYDRDLPACEVVREGYGLPTAAGDYRRWSGLASVGLRVEVQ
jgi:hypothetical protein